MAEQISGIQVTDEVAISITSDEREIINLNSADQQSESSSVIELNRCMKQIEFETVDIVGHMENLCVTDKELVNQTKSTNGIADGNDSGIDTGATPNTVVALQRALSSNSAGYASSSGGIDPPPFASCNSSLLSVCSELYDAKLNNLKVNNDCTSEGGSESSSVSGGPTHKRNSGSKKRVAVTEPLQTKSSRKSDNSVAKFRTRAASANRAAVQRSSGAPNLATTERARSRDKQTSANSNRSTMITRSSSMRRPVKPDSLPTNFKDVASPSLQRVSALSRTPSVTRRTPSCTPSTEDGRWPSIGGKSNKSYPRNGLSTPDNLVIKTKVGPIILENRTSADKCATLPRRRKEKSAEDLREKRSSRSNSVNRDRMVSSAIVRRVSSRESTPLKNHSHPPKGRKTSTKTLIYHEAAMQTAITSQDIDDAFAGKPKEIQINAITTSNKNIQVDIRDKEFEQLEAKLRQITTENASLQQNLNDRTQLVQTIEQQLVLEREEKFAMKKELHSNTKRVLNMLESVHAVPLSANETNDDNLLMLESQIQLSGHVIEEKQSEIITLRSVCKDLQNEMSRSIQVQQHLVEERLCFEKETTELQDFLQDEKTAIVEALKDAETEIEQFQMKLKQRESDVERLQDECRHLVRISEQRRQEYLGMQSKYTALESKSKGVVIQQNNAVSSATLALADLGSRLNSLVEQLVTSYSISEQELEDVIYHNGAYANSSEEPSPEFEHVRENLMNVNGDGSLSPQRHQSFIAAVINAIKSAASTAKQSVHKKTNVDIGLHADIESDTTEMLDSETEPCLMMDNVLEDVSMPDSHSHNMVSSTNSLLMVTPQNGMNKEEESLHNLCEAIANRQKIEQQANLMLMQHHQQGNNSDHSVSEDASGNESILDIPSISEQFTVQNLVDHVINVDNMVTKLLKVLRIIQIDNDNCVQQLIIDKNSLQVNKEEMLEKLKDWEEMNLKIKSDLGVASNQLIGSCTDLANSKMELQKCRNEINKLNEDICNLSTLCTHRQNISQTISTENILSAIKRWQANTENPESDLIAYISSICHEISNPQDVLSTNDNQCALNSNLQNCQNETITRAIETLNGIQSIVDQCPALIDLQRDLELMLPADCNANGTTNENQSISTDSAINHSIDLSV